jgi:hypothetical protein
MANKKQLAILKKGVNAWNKWREENLDVEVNLSWANLSKAELRKANFRKAQLDWANLCGARLDGSNLSEAQLLGTDLSDADLRETDFRKANLSEARLGGADLRRADLMGAVLSEAYLHNADFTGISLGNTILADNDLSTVKGLEAAVHFNSSYISIGTIYRSNGKIPQVFLRGCGVPENFITFMHSLVGQDKAFEFYSCFISHSAKDKRFCERLHADLQAKGVRVWYFPEDAKWGEPVWGEIDRSIKVYDKLVVVCSENSLQSGPVNREIERALVREDKEGKGILFPIRIDDYIFDTWEHERKADVVRKVVGDFSGWDKDAAKYDKAFEKLLKGLQAESGKA